MSHLSRNGLHVKNKRARNEKRAWCLSLVHVDARPTIEMAAALQRFTAYELRHVTAFELALDIAAQFHLHPNAARQQRHLDAAFPLLERAAVRVALDGITVRRDDGAMYCRLPWPSIVDIEQTASRGRADPDVAAARLLHAHSGATVVTFQVRDGALRLLMLRGEIAASALLKAVQHCASASDAYGEGGTADGDLVDPELGPAATHRGAAVSTAPPKAPPRGAILGIEVDYPEPPLLPRNVSSSRGVSVNAGSSPGLARWEVEERRKLAELRAQSEAMRQDIRPAATPSRSITPAHDDARRRAAASRRGTNGSRSGSTAPASEAAEASAGRRHGGHGGATSREVTTVSRDGARDHDVTSPADREARAYRAELEEQGRRIAAGDALASRLKRQFEDDRHILDASTPVAARTQAVAASPFISPGSPEAPTARAVAPVAAAAQRDRDDFLRRLDREAEAMERHSRARSEAPVSRPPLAPTPPSVEATAFDVAPVMLAASRSPAPEATPLEAAQIAPTAPRLPPATILAPLTPTPEHVTSAEPPAANVTPPLAAQAAAAIPASTVDAPSATPVAVAAASPPAPAGPPRELLRDGPWQELWDAAKGRVYYYNRLAKTTTWKVEETPFYRPVPSDATLAKAVEASRPATALPLPAPSPPAAVAAALTTTPAAKAAMPVETATRPPQLEAVTCSPLPSHHALSPSASGSNRPR
jgi:hypothetical protein